MSRIALLAMIGACLALVGMALFLIASHFEAEVAADRVARSAEIARLEEGLATLREEIAAFRTERAETPAPAPTEPSRPEAIRGDLIEDDEIFERLARVEETLLGGFTDDGGEEGADLGETDRSRLRAVLEEIREEERLAQEAERRERDLQRTRDRVENLVEPLGLSGAQAEEMTRILFEESEARRGLFTRLRGEGGGPGFGRGGPGAGSMGDEMRKIQETRDQELSRVLGDWQLEKYQESQRGRRGRGDRGDRGDRGRRRGRDGGGRDQG